MIFSSQELYLQNLKENRTRSHLKKKKKLNIVLVKNFHDLN